MKNEKATKARKVTGAASLSLTFDSARSSKAAYDALLQEADFSHRGGSKVFLSGKTVRVEIKADDPVSLRASINSYLRLMHIIKTVEQDIEKD
ncbi:MAG: KEOPS complex subunit Pcc1 [Candidatus Micrarchaeia archaeon]